MKLETRKFRIHTFQDRIKMFSGLCLCLVLQLVSIIDCFPTQLNFIESTLGSIRFDFLDSLRPIETERKRIFSALQSLCSAIIHCNQLHDNIGFCSNEIDFIAFSV